MSIGASSGCRGILIYDRSKDASKAVYGYVEGDEIFFVKGTYEEAKEIQKQHNMEKQNDKRTGTCMKWIFILYLMLLVCGLVCAVKDVTGWYQFIISVIVLIGTYIPLTSLVLSFTGFFKSKEANEQFKRFHGAEHKMMNCISDEIEVDHENMNKASIYANECGNVYTSSVVFYFLIFMLMMLNITEVGVFKTIGTLILLPGILFINMVNKYNPFKLFQKPAIAQPGEKEIRLAIAVYDKFMENENV